MTPQLSHEWFDLNEICWADAKSHAAGDMKLYENNFSRPWWHSKLVFGAFHLS